MMNIHNEIYTYDTGTSCLYSTPQLSLLLFNFTTLSDAVADAVEQSVRRSIEDKYNDLNCLLLIILKIYFNLFIFLHNFLVVL